MVNSVTSRPNHYETLGLSPGASADDIAEAFATTSRKHIEDPRSTEPDMRERARQIRLAHETLRDPAKRRAYDQSLGVTPDPEPEQARAAEPSGVPFVAAPSQEPPEQPPFEGSADPSLQEHRPSAPVAPVITPFVAAALRDPVKRRDYYTAAARSPEPKAQRQVEPEVRAEPEPLVQHEPEPQLAPEEEFPRVYVDTAVPDVEEPRARPRRAAAAVLMALLAAAALVAWLMWPFGRNVDRTPDTPSARTAPSTATPPMASSAMPQLPQQMPVASDETTALPQESDGSNSGSVAASGSKTVPTRIASPKSPTPAPAAAHQAAEAPPASEPDATAGGPEPLAEAQPATERQSRPSAPTLAIPVGATNPAPAPAPVPAPALGPNRQAPARLIGGGLTGRNNPHGQFEGTVSVRFVVGRGGEVSGCQSTASSGNPALDARTCALVAQRLRFAPALNPQGRPIASEMSATYNWRRAHRSLTGALLDMVRKRPQ